MTSVAPAYGLWSLAVINSLVFILFAFSFSKPKTRRDWRSFGAFSAFIVALFTEMYGFQLTIYLLSGWLQSRYPGLDPFSHDAGHLLELLFGWRANPHFGPFHLLSNILIFGGFILLANAWKVLHKAQQSHTTGSDRALCAHPPSPVRRVRADHAGLPVAVANLTDGIDVSGAGGHVRPSGADRRARGVGRVRRRLCPLRRRHPGILSALRRACIERAADPQFSLTVFRLSCARRTK